MKPALRTLIVDDDDVDRHFIKRLMPKTGLACAVEEACDGVEALQCVSTGHYDCVFLDNRLPDQDGVDLLPKLRERYEGELAVVMLTACGDEQLAVASLQGGAQHYLSKQDLDAGTLRHAIELAIERAANADALRRLSLYDDLTGLANRSLFHDRIAQMTRTAERSGKPGRFALLYLDLDRFKPVNDRYGHAAGDHVLCTVAQRLSGSMRQSDTLARLGGDEFAAILPTTDRVEGAIALAHKFAEVLRAPVLYRDTPLEVGVSVGIAMYPQHATEASALVQCADAAMYAAKRSNRLYAVHGERDGGRKAPRVEPEAPACDPDGRFALAFQPKVALADGTPCGMQAYVRWNHPDLGLTAPTPFARLAECAGIEVSLSFAALERAVREAAAWPGGAAVPLGVSMPAQVLDDHALLDKLLGVLGRHSFAPKRLLLEFAEPGLLRCRGDVRGALERLAGAGIRIGVDAVGTGCKPLGYLRGLPVAELKIARAFVADLLHAPVPATRGAVSGVVELARSLGAASVAQGVDSPGARDRLLEAGCDAGQGALWSLPVSSDAARAYLEQRGCAAPFEPEDTSCRS